MGPKPAPKKAQGTLDGWLAKRDSSGLQPTSALTVEQIAALDRLHIPTPPHKRKNGKRGKKKVSHVKTSARLKEISPKINSAIDFDSAFFLGGTFL